MTSRSPAPSLSARRTLLAAPATGLAAAALLGGLALGLPSREVAAHPLDLGYLRLDSDGASLAADLDLELGAAAHLLAVPEPTLDDPSALSARAAALADVTLRRALPTTDAGPCRFVGEPFASQAARTVSLTVRLECPATASSLEWDLPFVAEARISPSFQLLVKAHTGAGSEAVTTLDRHASLLTLSLDGPAPTNLSFGAFVWSGVEHIGAAPSQWHDDGDLHLPDGIDHILFLLALLLAGGTALQLVGITSGFTLGHSVTLALSALGVIRPPAALIEPIIALSIALVAAEAYLTTTGARPGNRRWKIATAFGLIHGFGFAGALNELGLSTADTVKALFGYNFGVELGQIAIVLVVTPLILLLQRRPISHRLVVRALSAAIFVAGMYWFAERALGSLGAF